MRIKYWRDHLQLTHEIYEKDCDCPRVTTLCGLTVKGRDCYELRDGRTENITCPSCAESPNRVRPK